MGQGRKQTLPHQPQRLQEADVAKKVYEVEINGIKHTMRFPEGEQPEGAVEVKEKAAPAPKNKARPATADKSKS